MQKPIIRNIVLVILTINVIIMIYIEQYMVSLVFALILIGDLSIEKAKKKKIKKTTPISEDVAEAMASKIIYEAQHHRKVREKGDHLNIVSNEEE